MKSHQNRILILLFVFLSQNLFSQPTITAFSPASGPVGATITITGTHFSNTPANNIVFFGAVRANVSTATTTSLTVTVPAGSTYQPVSVTVNGLSAYSAQSFITTFAGATSQFTSQSFEYAAHIDSVESNIETTDHSIGDIDNDGKIDIITVDRLNNTMSVYRNNSSGGHISFAVKVDFSTGMSPRAVKAADIDGDGKPDIVVTNLNANTVSVFKNTTTGTNISFALKADFNTAVQPSGIAIADLDKDGKPDLVVNTINLEGYVSVLRNTGSVGTISFAPKKDLASGGSIEDIKTADIDGDGKTDILLPNYNLNVVSYFRNISSTGNIDFAALFTTGAFQSPDQIELGDFNLDGKPDMIIGHYVNSNSPVFNNASTAGNIVFQYMNSLPGAAAPSGMAINDLDGDGKVDFAVTNGLESFSLFKNTSNTGAAITFSPGVTIPAVYNSQVSSADFDGDGIPDLVFQTGMLRVTIWKNRSASPQIYSFTPASGVSGDTITIHGAHLSGIQSIRFGGVDASSFLISDPSTIQAVVGSGSSGDIVVRSTDDSASISGFLFLGPPVLTSYYPSFGGTGDTITISGINFSDVDSIWFGGTQATSVFLSAPGTVKAIVGNGTSGNVQVKNLYGTAVLPGFIYYALPVISAFTPSSGAAGINLTITGTDFTTASSVTVGGMPVVSFTVLSSTTITAIVGEGKSGRIRITTPGGTAVSANPFSFPKPGITALVPASGVPGSTITIQGFNFISDTASNIVFFGAVRANVLSATANSLTVTVPSGATYSPVTVTLNGYTVYSQQPFIQIFQDGNKGITASSFQWKGAYGANEDPRDNYIFDMDGDGLTDIITRNDVTGTLSFLRNISTLGNPSFAASVDITGGLSDNATIRIGDLNSDGKPDITIANLGGAIIILKNTSVAGYISFEKKYIGLNYDPTFVALQDFDGDGKVDLAVCSNDILGTYGAVTLYPNVGTEGGITFGTALTIGLNGLPFEIESADMDNDGRPDIVLKNGDSVNILRNLGSPGNFSFDSPKSFSAFHNTGYFYYCIADFDGDGKPDIASSADQHFYILRNSSAGNIISFEPKQNFTLNETTEKIVAGQLDGDGKPDLVIVGEKKMFVFRNQSSSGAISFEAPVTYAPQLTYNWTDAAAIGDLDGDGKPDIAMANGADEKISVFRNQMDEITDSVCEKNSIGLTADVTGINYQWQLNSGKGFQNINDDSIYTGTKTVTLQILNTPMLYNGFQFRCMVDSNYRSTIILAVSPAVLPQGSATSPDTVCADHVFSIVFTGNNTVPVNSTIELWQNIKDSSFAMISTKTYSGLPVEYPFNVNKASTRSYFFRMIPPSTTPCGIPNNSDTTTTAVIQLDVPVTDSVGNTITIMNPQAGAVYNWQLITNSGIWNDVIPSAHGISYTAATTGKYRVRGEMRGCEQFSDEQKIVIDSAISNAPMVIVYPNPARDHITVEHPVSDASSTIRLIDLMGKIVKEYPVEKNSGQTLIRVDNVLPGVFKIVWTDGSRSVVRTVVISR